MTENKILKIIASIPVILVLLYFLPFVGICLIIFRYFVYRDRKSYELPIVLLIVAMLLLVPRGAELLLDTINKPITLIPYLSNVIESDIYTKIIKYGKFLFTLGIITIIVSYIVKTLYYKATTKISSAFKEGFNNTINTYIEKDAEIKEKNDLKIREKQERAKTTHSVRCPKCGGQNIIFEDVGVCKYCRNSISAK